MMWLLYACLSAIFAALVTIFAKMGVSTLNSTYATTLRTIIMAVLLIIITLVMRKAGNLTVSQLHGREITFLVLSGVAGALSLVFYFAALKTGDAGKVAVIDRMSLIFIAIFSALLFKEHFDIKGLLGILLVVVGAVLVSWR